MFEGNDLKIVRKGLPSGALHFDEDLRLGAEDSNKLRCPIVLVEIHYCFNPCSMVLLNFIYGNAISIVLPKIKKKL